MKRRKTFNKNIFIFSIAALALASVGFSSWIIGQIDSDKQISAQVQINGPISQVFLGEIVYKDGATPLSLRFDDKTNQDLDVGVSAIKTVVSSNLASGSYDIAFDQSTIDNNKVSLITSGQETQDVFGRNVSANYNYLTFQRGTKVPTIDSHSFKVDIDIAKLANSPTITGTQFKEYSIDISDLNISYGSYFDFKNPQDYYDTKLLEIKNQYLNAPAESKETAKQKYIKAIDQAIDELNMFVNVFTSQTIVINITGNYTFN